MVSPMQKKTAVELVVGMGLCQRSRACRILELNRSTAYYRCQVSPEKLAQEGLVEEVSRSRPCLGYEKITSVLRREHGLRINRKRVARLRRLRGTAGIAPSRQAAQIGATECGASERERPR